MADAPKSDPNDPRFSPIERSQVVAPSSAARSEATDRAADRTWFRARPRADHRHQSASDLELAAFGFPRATFVMIRPHEGEFYYIFACPQPASGDRKA